MYSATLLGGGELARREQGCALCACAGFLQRFLSPDLRLRCQLIGMPARACSFLLRKLLIVLVLRLLSVFSSANAPQHTQPEDGWMDGWIDRQIDM